MWYFEEKIFNIPFDLGNSWNIPVPKLEVIFFVVYKCWPEENTSQYHTLVVTHISRSWGHFTTRDWEPVTNTLQALSLVRKAEPVQVQASQYSWGTKGVGECKMDHVSWSIGLIFLNRLLEVGLIQDRETITLRMFTTVHLCYFVMCENLHE